MWNLWRGVSLMQSYTKLPGFSLRWSWKRQRGCLEHHTTPAHQSSGAVVKHSSPVRRSHNSDLVTLTYWQLCWKPKCLLWSFSHLLNCSNVLFWIKGFPPLLEMLVVRSAWMWKTIGLEFETRINGLIVAEANWFAFTIGTHLVPNLLTGCHNFTEQHQT